MSSCRVCSVCVRGIFAVMAVVNGSAAEFVVVIIVVVEPIVETRMAIVVFHRFQQGIVDAVEISRFGQSRCAIQRASEITVRAIAVEIIQFPVVILEDMAGVIESAHIVSPLWRGVNVVAANIRLEISYGRTVVKLATNGLS
jgi:hypothetical protein